MVVEGTSTASPSTYSADEFELSLSPASSVFHAVDGSDLSGEGPGTSDNEEYDTESEEERDSSTGVQGLESVGANASNSECSYSSLGTPADEDSGPQAEEATFSAHSSRCEDIEEKSKTAKQDSSRRAEEEVSFTAQSSRREDIEESPRTAKQDSSPRAAAAQEISFSGKPCRRQDIEEDPRTAKQVLLVIVCSCHTGRRINVRTLVLSIIPVKQHKTQKKVYYTICIASQYNTI